jgi:hypothetical protein
MNRWHSSMAARAGDVGKSFLAAPSLIRIMAAALLATPLLAAAGTWQTLTNPPPLPDIFDPSGVDQYPGGAAFPLLMTDGGVMVQNVGDGKIFKLTPDLKGSYVNGTWSRLATMPYVSYAGAQAVLPDGHIRGGRINYRGSGSTACRRHRCSVMKVRARPIIRWCASLT